MQPTIPIFKVRHLGGSALCNFHRLGVPEKALGGIPLGFEIIVELIIKPSLLKK